MKSHVLRLFVSLAGGLLLLGLLFVGLRAPNLVAAYGPPNSGEAAPHLTFHLWQINEIFSCGDGSQQFIELSTLDNDQQFLAGHQLVVTNLGGTLTNTFTFLSNSGAPTGNKPLLLATPGFSGVSGVTPDYTLPITSFLFTGGGKVIFAPDFLGGADILNYGAGQLPLDGIHSLNGDGVTGINSPTNFAGQTGSVACPLAVTKQGSAIVTSGSRITYTLTVTSNGTNNNAVLTDTIPANTTFALAEVAPSNGVLTWNLGSLLTSTIVSKTLAVTVNASSGLITNTNYGIRSDQSRATGLPVTSSINIGIYLPVILKNFIFVSEHAADLPN